MSEYVEGDFLLNKINFVGGDKLLPVFKHGFLRLLQTWGSHVWKLAKACLLLQNWSCSRENHLRHYKNKMRSLHLYMSEYIYHVLVIMPMSDNYLFWRKVAGNIFQYLYLNIYINISKYIYINISIVMCCMGSLQGLPS